MIFRTEQEGQRKAVITKMALICFTLTTWLYLGLVVVSGGTITPDFMAWLAIGVGGISGSAFAANGVEHWSKNRASNNKGGLSGENIGGQG